MVCRFSPLLLAALAVSVANPLKAAPPTPPEQPGTPRAMVPVRPVGIWVRDIGNVKVVLKLTDDRLTSTAIFATDSKEWPVVRVALDLDYAISKDGTLFSFVFGADATQPMYATIIQRLNGLPIAFGWRVDGDTLTVRNLKGLGGEFEELPLLGNGRYTRMDEAKLPEWEKKLTGTSTPLMRSVSGGMTAPSSNPAPSAPPLSGVPTTVSKSSSMLKPVPPSPMAKLDTLRELDQTAHRSHVVETPDILRIEVLKGVPKPAYQLEPQINGQHLVRLDGTIGLGPYGKVPVSGKSLAEAKKAIEKHLSQYLLDPEVSLEVDGVDHKNQTVKPAARVVPAPVSNPLHGTWLQEKDGMQVILNFTEKRLNVEINAAFTVPGQQGPPIRFTQSMDADYSTSPDGTVFGILTGIDVRLGEGLPPEAYASIKEGRREFEKMIGAMFKFRTRMDGGRMTLTEARASTFDSVRGPTNDAKSDTKGLVGELFGGRFERMTGTIPPPKPNAGGIINQYSTDPSVQIEQLQKSKNELRQQGDEWRKFWNNDLPNQITAPKCKDCAPPLKEDPEKRVPSPPAPMSQGLTSMTNPAVIRIHESNEVQ